MYKSVTKNNIFYQQGKIFIVVISLYGNLAIENTGTASQNTGKPLNIWLYYTQPSHHAPRECHIDCVHHFIFDSMV